MLGPVFLVDPCPSAKTGEPTTDRRRYNHLVPDPSTKSAVAGIDFLTTGVLI